MTKLPRTVVAYVAAVCVIGTTWLVVMVSTAGWVPRWELAGLLTLATIAGEIKPIKVPLGAEGMEITVSTSFGFALLLEFGPAYAAVAMAAAAIVADLLGRKASWKIAFNASQYVIAIGVSGLAISLVGGPAIIGSSEASVFGRPLDVLGATVGALAFLLTNVIVLAVALGLAQQTSILRLLRHDFARQAMSSIALLSLSPIAVVVGDRSPLLLPLLLIPVGAAYRSALVSLENEHQALHDSLTGLPNRSLFRVRVADALAVSPNDGSLTAVMLIDLDRFKEINDTLGHSTGDRVLRVLGPRLSDGVRSTDTVARLGGDEFGVVLPNIGSPEEAHALAARLLDTIRRPVQLDDLDLEVDASIGVAFHPHHGDDADTLIQRADIAMYAAKEDQSGVLEYAAKLDHTSPVRLMLVKELRGAIENGGLLVYFQPKVDVTTGRAVGAEALVRWDHPTRGIVAPDEFIPIAEQTGLIRDLTVFVLREAISSCRQWQARGLDLSVSVNVSARTLHDLMLPTRIDELLGTHGLEASKLIVEITETTVMANVANAAAQLAELRSRGVRISLDDYGTGHSSLAQLKRLPIDELKIDKSFITSMTEDSSDELITASTIDLATRLGLRVVAEGVETEQTWEQLRTLGCHLAQGYYFSRPLPADEFIRWCEDRIDRTAVTPPRASSSPALAR